MIPPRTLMAAALGAAIATSLAAGARAATVRPNPADQALAKRSILHITDFTPGSGWVAAPIGGSASSANVDPSCDSAGSNAPGRVQTGTATSSFKAPGLQVWSTAEVVQTVAMGRGDVAEMTPSAVTRCLSAMFTKSLPANAKLVSVHKFSFPQVADWTTAYRAVIDVSVAGTNVRMQADLVLVLSRRVEITLAQIAPYAISAQSAAAELRLVEHLAGASLAA